MVKKLYVGGIAYATTDDGLRQAFEQAGTVETASIVIDRESGRSKGFGFVEMATEEEAQAAINMWNGKELDGRTLVVNEARPKEDRPSNGGGYRSGGSNFGGGYRGNR
ncbi:MAG TPA: RNA-binding protein [Patescibacteria group bacterium]